MEAELRQPSVKLPDGYQLRPYQLESFAFLTGRGSAICGDEMGLGKTPTSLVSIRELVPEGPFLVLCPKVAIGVWADHVANLLGEEALVYHGTPAQRAKVNPVTERRPIIAPYSMADELAERKREWPALVLDEAHILRNRPEVLFSAVSKLRAEHVFPLTGTPIVNRPLDIWPLLHLIDRVEFSSYWRFVNTFFHTMPGQHGGVEIFDYPKDKKAFRRFVNQYMVRHLKRKVLTELPDKIRRKVPLTLKSAQEKIYRELEADLIAEYGDMLFMVPNTVAQLTRLRQLLVTPALFGGPHESAAFEALEDSLEGEFDSGRPCVVFTPFPSVFPLLQDLADKLNASHYQVRGGMTWPKIRKAVDDFRNCPGARKVIFCSLGAATSYDLTCAPSCFFLGFDWVPAVNEQAEDRLHRYGQRDSVIANYFVHEQTVDQYVLSVVAGKMDWKSIKLGIH